MSVDIVEVKPLQKMLQRFNEDLGVYMNDEERYKLGRVLTIIDAAIADPEQRKAIKDLVQNEWWTHGVRATTGSMLNPHTDMRGICKALGFELYDPTASEMPQGATSDEEYATKRYAKVAQEQ